MAEESNLSMMRPPIEDLLARVDSKFTLVTISARRARQINAYFSRLGDGIGSIVPPQVDSISKKSLTVAFEEIAAGKITYSRPDPNAIVEAAEDIEALDEDEISAGSLDTEIEE